MFPAEFELHDSIWMAWPRYENKKGRPTDPVHMQILKATSGHVAVDLLVVSEGEVRALLDAAGIAYNHVRFHSIPYDDVWLRDTGPIFLKGSKGSLKIADFRFSMWGYEGRSPRFLHTEAGVVSHIAESMDLEIIKSSLVSEGGNHEVNGRGTMLSVRAVEQQRNPGVSLEEIESELRRVLGQEKVIWLESGVAEDGLTFKGKLPGGIFSTIATGGHVDQFARFINSSTVLLAEVSVKQRDTNAIAAISFERLERSRDILERSTCQDSGPLDVVRIPVPELIVETVRAGDDVFDCLQSLNYEDGTVIGVEEEIQVVAASSYLNFQITNGLVLMPVYWKPGMPDTLLQTDQHAQQILAEAFPNRDVVPIDVLNANLGGGGLHCMIQPQPAV